MSSTSPSESGTRHNVVLVSARPDTHRTVGAALANHDVIGLQAVESGIEQAETRLRLDQLAVLIVELDPASSGERAALERVARRAAGKTAIIAIPTTFDPGVARWLLKIKVGDFLTKPVATADLVRTVTRAITGSEEGHPAEARIHAFMPASGGVGATTLAVESAFVLAGEQGRKPVSTCIVDLNFQYGACADYLDVEPQLELDEIEQRPERLDRQLLEVMLAHHPSGISVIAAPPTPLEMRSFDPLLVTRLLDLVSAYFDDVVIDLPRTWFQWTEHVLRGCDRLFIVAEMTVPGIRHAQRLIRAVDERTEGQVNLEVVINRFEQRMFDSGLTRADLQRALNGVSMGVIANNYRLVREAIDRGVPLEKVRKGNDVTLGLRKILTTGAGANAGPQESRPLGFIARRLFARPAA
jgi:pilus assembly protein CpaE